MRSPRELFHRLQNEVANVALWILPPTADVEHPSPLKGLPDPARVVERCRDTAFSAEVVRLAELVQQHRFPVLDGVVNTGPEVDWRRDYRRQISSSLSYCRTIPYLDASRVGDHKLVWELNRHQHLVLLAQAFLLTGRADFVAEIWRQLESWLTANPFMRSINWASALEVGFRTLSWLWVYHLAGSEMPKALRRRFFSSLYQHGRYLEQNLSFYFSPNTHLMGEAVALHALGTLCPSLPRASTWAATGARVMAEQLERQVRPDGSHFEQASYYHLYATDLLAFHTAVAGGGQQFYPVLEQMATYLSALMGPARSLPFIGDDDGGRVFHPYGPRDRFGRATLATCGVLLGHPEWTRDGTDLYEQGIWWLGEGASDAVRGESPEGAEGANKGSQLFAQAGIAIMSAGDLHVIADAGPFGGGSAGHSHSDTLSLIIRRASEEILVDPGTYTYVDPRLREQFRGSLAHNTVRVDGMDQATPLGPFRWGKPPTVELLRWLPGEKHDFLEARCRYAITIHGTAGRPAGETAWVSHMRRVLFLKPHADGKAELIVVHDRVQATGGEHEFEQVWHLGQPPVVRGEGFVRMGADARLVFPRHSQLELVEGNLCGWRSTCYGEHMRAHVVIVRQRTSEPASFWTALDLAAGGEPVAIEATSHDSDICRYLTGVSEIVVDMSEPRIGPRTGTDYGNVSHGRPLLDPVTD